MRRAMIKLGMHGCRHRYAQWLKELRIKEILEQIGEYV